MNTAEKLLNAACDAVLCRDGRLVKEPSRARLVIACLALLILGGFAHAAPTHPLTQPAGVPAP